MATFGIYSVELFFVGGEPKISGGQGIARFSDVPVAAR